MKKLLILTLTLTGMSLFGMEMEITPPVTQNVTFITKDKQSFTISPEVANLIPTIRGIAAMGQFTQESKVVDGNTFQLIVQAIEQFLQADTTQKLLGLDANFFTKHTFSDTPALTRNVLAPILKGKSAEDIDEFKKAADFLGIEGFADAATAIQNKAPQVYSIADLVALEQVPEITQGKLNLSHKNLVSAVGIALIPEIKTVTQLILDSNQLQSLPNTIGKLQNLTRLYLQNNRLQSLPATIGNLQNLTYLSLEDNQLQSLPDTIGNLQNLTDLYLDNNQLQSLPATIGNLQNLITLSLAHNLLQSLPNTIGNLQSLMELFLEDNQLQSLPDTIGNLQNLSWLTLENNPLSDATKQFLNQLQQQHPDLKIYMDE